MPVGARVATGVIGVALVLLTAHNALAELRRCAGAQFDARVVAAFERVPARRMDPAEAAALAA